MSKRGNQQGSRDGANGAAAKKRRSALSASAQMVFDPSLRKAGKLVFEDGTEFSGYSFGADVAQRGEIVFNTGMVGYPESGPRVHAAYLMTVMGGMG